MPKRGRPTNKERTRRSARKHYKVRSKSSNCRGLTRKTGCTKKNGCKYVSGDKRSFCRKRTNKTKKLGSSITIY